MVRITPSSRTKMPKRKQLNRRAKSKHGYGGGCFIFIAIAFSVHYLYLVWTSSAVPGILLEVMNTTELQQQLTSKFSYALTFEDLMKGVDVDELLEAYGKETLQFQAFDYGGAPLDTAASTNIVQETTAGKSREDSSQVRVVDSPIEGRNPVRARNQINQQQGQKDPLGMAFENSANNVQREAMGQGGGRMSLDPNFPGDRIRQQHWRHFGNSMMNQQRGNMLGPGGPFGQNGQMMGPGGMGPGGEMMRPGGSFAQDMPMVGPAGMGPDGQRMGAGGQIMSPGMVRARARRQIMPGNRTIGVQRFGPFTDALKDEEKFLDNNVTKDLSHKDMIGFHPNRSIAFIHIGKSGGISLRSFTSLTCRLDNPAAKDNKKIQSCVDQSFPADATLSRQVKSYFHMHGYFREQISNSTSFLFLLRHPVDRIISAIRYSHPDNCHPDLKSIRRFRPWGCSILEASRIKGSVENRAWGQCFPSASDLDYFAQSVMSPFPPFNASAIDLVSEEQAEFMARMCRSTARDLTMGRGPHKPGPHLFFNFGYYVKLTLFAFPEKEVFAIRTEHEWEDMNNLDLAIGGAGKFRQDSHFSHGSEKYKKSKISTEGYHKLCCILETEIAMYQTVLDRAINLNQTEKDESMQRIITSCGIEPSIDVWRRQCQAKFAADDALLRVRSNEMMANSPRNNPVDRAWRRAESMGNAPGLQNGMPFQQNPYAMPLNRQAMGNHAGPQNPMAMGKHARLPNGMPQIPQNPAGIGSSAILPQNAMGAGKNSIPQFPQP